MNDWPLSKICSNCLTPHAQKFCTRCKIAYYCDRDCQVKHWPTHKTHCNDNEIIIHNMIEAEHKKLARTTTLVGCLFGLLFKVVDDVHRFSKEQLMPECTDLTDRETRGYFLVRASKLEFLENAADLARDCFGLDISKNPNQDRFFGSVEFIDEVAMEKMAGWLILQFVYNSNGTQQIKCEAVSIYTAMKSFELGSVDMTPLAKSRNFMFLTDGLECRIVAAKKNTTQKK